MKSLPSRITLFLSLASASLSGPAWAAANLVTNGDFEQTSLSSSAQMTATNVSNWSTSGYNFLFLPGTADTTGATTSGGGNLKLYGPNGGTSNSAYSANGMPLTSPTGGNFVGADGAFGVGAISQTIGGLSVGANYLLSFYWAAGQQAGFTGITTESWNAAFGTQSFNTATVTTPSQGFTPWTRATMVFTASSASQTLSFLAAGTPNGQPPFSLLDGISVTFAPEPAGWAMFLVGLSVLTIIARRRA